MAGENPQTTMPRVPKELEKMFSRESVSWLQQLQRILSFTGGVAWEIVNKAGSKLSDIVTRPHSMLQDVLGTGDRHITAAENAEITALDGLGAGMVAKTGDAAYSARTVTGTSGEVEVTNGSGVAGNPVIGLPVLISTPRKFGTETDSTEIEADGTIKLNGAATTWNDINIPGTAFRSVGAAALGTFTLPGTGLAVTTFTGTGALVASGQSSFEILHDYKEGTDITPHLHWCATTPGAGNVKWQLEYAWVNRDGTIATSTTISVTAAASGVVGKEQATSLPAISGAGKTIGGRFQFRVFRDPADVADTYATDAGLFDFGIHYESDTLGSRHITAK